VESPITRTVPALRAAARNGRNEGGVIGDSGAATCTEGEDDDDELPREASTVSDLASCTSQATQPV
jgi:hypothetical protein